MPITEKKIKEFQQLYKKEKGEEISYEEAQDSLISLVEMLRLVYKPIKKSDYLKYKD